MIIHVEVPITILNSIDSNNYEIKSFMKKKEVYCCLSNNTIQLRKEAKESFQIVK